MKSAEQMFGKVAKQLETNRKTASDYGCNGNHDSDLIADAFRQLAKALS